MVVRFHYAALKNTILGRYQSGQMGLTVNQVLRLRRFESSPSHKKASQVGIHCKIVLQNGVVPRCKNIDKSLWFVRGWTVESIRDSTNVTTEIIWVL